MEHNEVFRFFGMSDSEPLEINLIANGEKRINQLKIPTGRDKVEERYTIKTMDEQLTQVIYTRKKG